MDPHGSLPPEHAPPPGAAPSGLLAAIVESSEDPIISKSLDGTITSWNPAAERLLGYSAAEIVGKPISTLIPSDRLAEEEQIIARLRRGERLERFETVRRTRDGRLLTVSLTISPIRDASGAVVGASKILRDITARRAAESALRDSEIRHRAILDAALDAVITIDERGLVESMNPAGVRLFGYDEREVVGQNVSMLMPEPYRSGHDQYLANYMKTGQARIIGIGREVVGRRRDGSTFPIELAVTELKLSGRRLFTGTVRDITARKRAEQALRDSESRFRSIADTIPQLIWTAGSDGVPDYCNARWSDYTGLNLQQTRERGWTHAVHSDDAAPIAHAWASCLKNGLPCAGECRLRGRRGEYRWFLLRGLTVRDAEGRPVQWIASCTDIDDQKHAAELQAAKAQAEASSRAKSEFLANMSHEIRTPMTAILGYADQLLEPDQTVSDRQNAVNVIRRNGAHLLAVINDILDLSRIEAGSMPIEQVACSPCEILSDVASLMRARAQERGLAFELRTLGPIPATIRSDPFRLRQILINLVSNAVKFTPGGFVRLSAVLLTDGPEPFMRFDVADSGIGMTPEQISRLFQPFSQADTSTTRRFGGTGLGLTISQRLAHAMGGRIEVQSVPGQGSSFSAFIPAGPLDGVPMLRDCTEALAHAEAPASVSQDVPLRGRILLAEDGPDNQDLIGGYLRKAGAEVTVADNGRIALERFRDAKRTDKPFDLILMDMQMPELDGYSAAARLRMDGFRGPIIALTAHAMATDRARCIRAGCTDYLSKPIKRDALLRAVHAHLFDPAAPAPAPKAAVEEPPVHDEVLNKYRPAFIAHLPEEAAAILRAAARGDAKEVGRLAHRLGGAAGMFFFTDLNRTAVAIETLVHQGAPIEALRPKVQELVGLMRAVPGYDASREAPQGA